MICREAEGRVDKISSNKFAGSVGMFTMDGINWCVSTEFDWVFPYVSENEFRGILYP
jgi:hypothetical protein